MNIFNKDSPGLIHWIKKVSVKTANLKNNKHTVSLQ